MGFSIDLYFFLKKGPLRGNCKPMKRAELFVKALRCHWITLEGYFKLPALLNVLVSHIFPCCCVLLFVCMLLVHISNDYKYTKF